MIDFSVVNPLVTLDLEDPLPAALAVWRDALEDHDPRERELATEVCRAVIYRTLHELEAFGRGRRWDRAERARIEDSLRYDLARAWREMSDLYHLEWCENQRGGGVWTIEIDVLEQPCFDAAARTLRFYLTIN